LAFSPDGTLLAVGTNIGQVKLFNKADGKVSQVFDDRSARLADKETPESWQSLARAMGSVRSLAFSPDGNLLAVCGESFTEFADLFDGIERLGLPVSGPGRLKVWDIHRATLKHDLPGHSQAYAVGFSSNGGFLASAGRWDDSGHGNGIVVWNPQSGGKIPTIDVEANGGTHSVAFSPTKKLLVAGSRAFDKENDTSKTLITVAYPLSGLTEWQQSVAGWAKPLFSADGKTVVVLSNGQSIRLFDAETGTPKQQLNASSAIPWNDIAIAAQTGTLVIGGSDADGKGFVEVRNLPAN
jgi:WD40 repeat protein